MSELTPAAWSGFYDQALMLQPGPPAAPVHGIRGRFITSLVAKLCKFWGDHQAELIPFLSQLAIAALNALVAAQTDINAVNPPGPE